MNQLKTAELIARLAHKGQKDKQGEPYILHPMAVAARLESEDDKIIGLLHDVMEDTDVTEAELRNVFDNHIVDTLLLLTHKEGEDYFDYIDRISKDATATRVKMADLSHNMDPSRCKGEMPEKYKSTLMPRYKKAMKILKDTEKP